MRATIINHRYLPFRGGSELYVQIIAEWLAERGWSVRVVTTDAFDLEYFWDRERKAIDAPTVELINGVQVERLKVRHPPGSALMFHGIRRGMGEASRYSGREWPFDAMSRILPRIEGIDAAIREGRHPDVIIAANLGLESIAASGLRASRELGIPFVFLPFAHLGGGPDDPARRYVSMPHQRALVKQADLLLALTTMEATFLEDMGTEPFRICVAGAGVDLDPDDGDSNASDVHRDRFTILSVGALAREKGTMDLVEASRKLKREGWDHRLILVGPELSEFSRWFRNTGAVDCDWIELRGVVSDEEKSALFRTADAFALPSRTESFGIVYLEAWAHCLPVVAAGVGAVTEVVRDGVDGILVPYGCPEAIATALSKLMESPELVETLGNAGYEKIGRNFTWEVVLGRIESAFDRVLGIEV